MLRQGTSADERIGWTFSFATGLLSVWACFVAFVTWLDWHGALAYFVAHYPLWFSRGMYFLLVIVLLVWVRAVLGSAQRSRLGRSVVALSIVWLLVLPFIPGTPMKALIMGAARLGPGMSAAQVQAIMMTHQGVHKQGGIFCTDDAWENDKCDPSSSSVSVYMEGDHLVSVSIDLD